jgi:hypothetical protein
MSSNMVAGGLIAKPFVKPLTFPKRCKMVRDVTLAAALTLAAVTSSVAAQGQGDEKERAACRPDVVRFCKEFVKDKNEDVVSILNCLESNRSRISKECSQVLTNHGQ